jgi:hypothetical protein
MQMDDVSTLPPRCPQATPGLPEKPPQARRRFPHGYYFHLSRGAGCQVADHRNLSAEAL